MSRNEEQLANTFELCARCKNRLAESLPTAVWDQLQYCRRCVEQSGLADVDPDSRTIEESHRFGFWRGMGLGLYTGFLLTTGVALVLFGIFLLLSIAFLMGGVMQNPAQPIDLARQLRTFAFFFLFAWAFVGVIGFPMGVFGTLFALRRSIRVNSGVMTYDAGLRHVMLPLSDCYWFISSTCIDVYTIVSLRRPSIIVRTSKEMIVCGFSPESLRFWQAYLSLVVGPAIPKHNWFKNWKTAAYQAALWTVSGWLLGRLMQAITGHPMWTSAATFLGMLDGLVSSAFVLLRGHPKAKLLSQNAIPWMSSLTFATLGAKVGIGAGWPGLIVCLVVNGIVGWFLGRDIQRRFRILEAEPKVDDLKGDSNSSSVNADTSVH